MTAASTSPGYGTVPDPTSGDKHCVFRIGEGWFSIPATAVREITVAPELVPVPGSHSSLAGLCHVRSEFLPVLQLHSVLQEPADDRRCVPKLLVIEGTNGSWALLIDEVVALESLETLIHPDQRPDVAHSPILGTATYRDRIVRVLDPNTVFRLAHDFLHRCWDDLSEPRQASHSPARSEP